MLETMSWRQLQGWMEFYALDPFGEERADLRMGILASLIANSHRDAKQTPTPYAPSDFMPFAKSAAAEERAKKSGPLVDASQWAVLKSQMAASMRRRG